MTSSVVSIRTFHNPIQLSMHHSQVNTIQFHNSRAVSHDKDNFAAII